MSFNIEVQGGKNYILPTGGKYCPQDIAIAAIGGATEGMYCWQKSHKVIEYPNLTTTGITLTPSGNGFTITSSSGNAWASHLIHSPVLSTEGKDINVIHTISGTAYPYFIGFSSNAETVHTAFDHCVYIVNGGTIQHIASNAVVGEYGSYAVGDVIRINLKDGKFTAYKNESFLFSVDYALESVVMNATFHYGSVNYGTIECSVVEETDKSYVLSDDLNAYPQDGYHTDGYYYKLMDSDIVWDERGQYAWSQATGPADVFYEFATKKNMTVSGNALTSGSSASGWDSAYVVTAGIDVSDPELEVRIEHTIPATGRSYFIAVSDTKATASSQFDHTMFVNGTSLLQGTSGSGQIGTCTVGDVVGLSIKNGTVSYLKNGSALTTGTLSASTVYFTVMVNGASINWGNFIVSTPGAEPFGYVIGNEEDAYPNDGFADDGYYYVKVGATKVSPKYASGTVTTGTVNGTVGYISVSGLGFRPYAIQGFYSTQGIFYAVCDSNGNLSTAKYRASSNNITDATSTFSVTDDGFSGRVGNTTEVVYTWYAIGY